MVLQKGCHCKEDSRAGTTIGESGAAASEGHFLKAALCALLTALEGVLLL